MTATVEVHLRKRYQCSLCRKSWSAYPLARRHIFAGCLKDPATKGCPTCSHDCFGLRL